MTMHRSKFIPLPVLLTPMLAVAQPPAPAVTAPLAPAVALPLERSTYFIGETIPIQLNAPGVTMDLVDACGAVVSSGKGTASQNVWRLDTGKLAPGEYSLRVANAPDIKIILVTAQRSSPGAIFDECLPTIPSELRSDKKKYAEFSEKIDQAFRESGINALILVGQADGRQYTELDSFGRFQTMLWANFYTRPNSFVPARVYQAEMENMAQRAAHYAAMNARYPNFGGMAYTWDPTGYDRSMLLVYWGWSQHEKALRAYNKRSIDAIYEDFRNRTGLEPVTTPEFLRYALAAGHPDWAPAFDLPTAVWMTEISKKSPSLSPTEFSALQARVDAWAKYITSVLLGESNAYFQKWLKEAAPTMTGTASMDNEFSPRDGAWPPAANAPLDFRWVEAWSDQVGGPDYTYQWLFHAALTDIGAQPGQPVWVGSVLGWAHHQAPYPGRFSRSIAQNLAYGGRGIGFAVEGFSNVMGGMYAGTHWWNMKGTPGEEDFRLGQEWLRRFAPLQEQSTPTRKVGILLSLTQYGRQYTSLSFDKPQFNAFITLARLGYTPHFVTEDQIEKDGLKNYRALVIVNQSAELPSGVLEKLKTFQASGGQVLLSKNSKAAIPNALPLDIAEPDRRAGRPHNWLAPNTVGKPSALLQNARFDELAPTYRKALGEALRTPLIPEGDEKSRVSTFGLGSGVDATYVVATNDSFNNSPSTWTRQEVTLRPNGASPYTALYDLSAEKYLGNVAPIKAGFMDRTARMYALLTRPVNKIDMRATQKIASGEPLVFSVAFLDKNNQPLRAAIPFVAKLSAPTGALAQEWYRSTNQNGAFGMRIPTAANDAGGRWTISIRSLLDGNMVTLPIEVQTTKSKGSSIAPVETNVITRGNFAALLKDTTSFVAPIFDGPNKTERLAAAKAAQGTLAAKGVKVEIVDNPIITTYTKGYDPSPEELAENARADKGETFGKIKRLTVNSNDYFAVKSGWVYPRPLLLFDSLEANDNPLAETIAGAGMVWPSATSNFPGPGRAILQIVKSAFKLGTDTVIIQAGDGAGLLAGANALANPPADWISPGIEKTRTTLTRELSIGRQSAAAIMLPDNKLKLTNKGAQNTQSPQPLVLKFDSALPPLAGEVPEWQAAPVPVTEIPAKLEIPKAGVPYILEGEKWIRADTPGGNWPSDLRFSQATLLKLKVPVAGKYNFALSGVFRFWDRKPSTQSIWEETVDLYMKTTQPKREPLHFDVLLDGKPLGALGKTTASEIEISPTFGTFGKGEKIKEEGVTQVSGTLELPAGEHELLLIHKNIVDGVLKTAEVSNAN